ncbi:MAG TPA: hypothetical protein VG317_12125 [Pseudonocardiaceae bacterium]|nr:hypothetical protein [Pseudonocardiaceae bacterium]
MVTGGVVGGVADGGGLGWDWLTTEVPPNQTVLLFRSSVGRLTERSTVFGNSGHLTWSIIHNSPIAQSRKARGGSMTF